MREPLARFGQREASRDALEQRQPDRFLELPYLHRHGRLRQVQFLGRAREARAPACDHEDLQLAQCQRADEVHDEEPRVEERPGTRAARATVNGSRGERSPA